MKIALVVPHIFMNQTILPEVIFSPGELALSLAEELVKQEHEVSLFSPGSVASLLSNLVKNITADLSLFELELSQRGDSYLDLLKKHPLTFITLARQVQSELVVQAFEMANQGEFDLVHIWCNEEEQALVNARFCQVPTVFNHHEPFNFLTRYRAIFPKYCHLNWLSFSFAQRKTFEEQCDQPVNWVGNIYHGLDVNRFIFANKQGEYLVYMGRIIQPKGVHYAIACAKKLGLPLKIAGKHYAGHSKDKYWQEFIEPEINGENVEYVGFVKTDQTKQELLGSALALLMPSIWQEPFGMVMLEAMACGTPVVGFNQGAVKEVVKEGRSGSLAEFLPEPTVVKNGREVSMSRTELQQSSQFQQNVRNLVQSVKKVQKLNRQQCCQYFEENFTLKKMAQGYEEVYERL